MGKLTRAIPPKCIEAVVAGIVGDTPVDLRDRALRFHPLSPEQVGELMAAASILKPDQAGRAHCLRFLIGLLYCTGLRIGEALALNLGDVDARQSTLFVRRGIPIVIEVPISSECDRDYEHDYEDEQPRRISRVQKS